MRIAISVENNNGLDSLVCQHFGGAPYFILVDLDGQEVKTVAGIENPYFGNHQPGQIPQLIHSHNASVMLTGGMGRRAIAFFDQFGVQPVTGATGTVRQAVQSYLDGRLNGAAPCAHSDHHHDHDHSHGHGHHHHHHHHD